MSTVFEIPSSAQAQTFTITLIGVVYTFSLQWNSVTNTWQIDVLDVNNNPLVTGIPMVANVDLLEQYGYLNFGGKLIAQTDNAPDVAPTYTNLGTTGHLYFVTP